jgi:hypothetical protein
VGFFTWVAQFEWIIMRKLDISFFPSLPADAGTLDSAADASATRKEGSITSAFLSYTSARCAPIASVVSTKIITCDGTVVASLFENI